MFSDAEQRRLAEIESSLRADDPRFVHGFESGRREPRHRGVLALLTIILGVAATVTALVFVVVPLAVCGLVCIGAGIGVWTTHRRA